MRAPRRLFLSITLLSPVAALAAPRSVGEVKCDVDGDGGEKTVRLTVDDKDHSTLMVMRAPARSVGEVAGPISPNKLETRQVVRDKACEIAITTDGSVKLALYKWRKKGFAEIARFEKTPPAPEQSGDEDLLVQSGKSAAGRTVWVWNADKFVFDGPVVEARCDVDGDGSDDAVRLGADALTVVSSKGKTIATLPLPAGTPRDQPFVRQAVADSACEIALAPRAPNGQRLKVWKWHNDKLALVADLHVAASATVAWKTGADSVVEVRDGKKLVEAWRWNEPRFAFRLREGTPAGLCGSDKDCAATGYCDLTLVEEKPVVAARKKGKGKAAAKPAPQGICGVKPAEAQPPKK